MDTSLRTSEPQEVTDETSRPSRPAGGAQWRVTSTCSTACAQRREYDAQRGTPRRLSAAISCGANKKESNV
jgi:hypothetical protein